MFTQLVQKHGFEAKNLHLEITETAVMSDTKKVIRLVNKLRQYGFKVEMDDFGSGYSSLNMLKDIKMDTIKLDMGFLRKTRNNERSMSIVSNVIHCRNDWGWRLLRGSRNQGTGGCINHDGVRCISRILFCKTNVGLGL